MENQLRIVVVDDQELVRKGIIHMLSSIKDYKIVGEASSGEEAVDVGAAASQATPPLSNTL